MCKVVGWQDLYIPCYAHGDGVEFQENNNLLVFSYGSLLTTGSSMDTCLLLGAWPKNCTAKGGSGTLGTWDVIYKVLCWSFVACFWGIHPVVDYEGKPHPDGSYLANLAGQPLVPTGHRLVIWALLGDHEYMSNTLGLPHWSSRQWCWLCDGHATDQSRDWRELRPNVRGWVHRTIVEELANRISSHPFFQLPGVTCFTVSLDGLHILYCKGVLSLVFGSFLHTLLWKGLGRQTVAPATKLAAIFQKGARALQGDAHHRKAG